MNNYYFQFNQEIVTKIIQCMNDNPTDFDQILKESPEYNDCRKFINKMRSKSMYYVKQYNLSFKDIAIAISRGVKIPTGRCVKSLR